MRHEISNEHGNKDRDHGKPCEKADGNQDAAEKFGEDQEVERQFGSNTDRVAEHRCDLVIVTDLAPAVVSKQPAENKPIKRTSWV